ncbi:HIRAN domain-containing protein [Aquabacterium sp.]|uniref:HIRAN domain-containing protein n=1 Tax=Aquabacterium sp. TaxID=1872578 RepID=UPI003BAF0249
MKPLISIVEPIALLLTWQPEDESSQNRTRRVVGEVSRVSDSRATFRYLSGTADYKAAFDAGFKGFAPFWPLNVTTDDGVLDTFMRRLPPKRREDFSEFLARHRLPQPFTYSDFALLGYTGAKLPSDGFALVPVFPSGTVNCDFIAELAGVRHVFDKPVGELCVGDPVELVREFGNIHDANAIAVYWAKNKLGYVNRVMCPTFCEWLSRGDVTATIERVNGKPERPLVYVRVQVRPKGSL